MGLIIIAAAHTEHGQGLGAETGSVPDDPAQLEAALSEYSSTSPMLYDWSDEDLGDGMIIARLPSHKVWLLALRTADTPRTAGVLWAQVVECRCWRTGRG